MGDGILLIVWLGAVLVIGVGYKTLTKRREHRHVHVGENYQLYRWWTGCPNCGFNGDNIINEPEGVYTGISNNTGRRLGEHAAGTLEDVVNARPLVCFMRPYPKGTSRTDAEVDEKKRITRHRDPFNQKHNPDWNRKAAVRTKLEGGQVGTVEQVSWANYQLQAATKIVGTGIAGYLLIRLAEAILV